MADNKRKKKSYLRNLTSSIGRASFDVMKDLNPVISENYAENKQFVAEHYDKVRNFITSDDGLRSTSYYKASKDLIKNALREIKTGEIYTKETQEKAIEAMADAFQIDMDGFDFDFDFDMDEGDKPKSSSKTTSSSEETYEEDTKTTENNVDITHNTTKTINRTVTNNLMMSHTSNKSTNKILSSSSRAMLQANKLNTSALLQGINTIRDFQQENTVKFYNDVSEKLADIGNSINNISNMFGAGNHNTDDSNMYDSEVEDLLMNGLKLDFYKRKLSKSMRKEDSIFSLIKEYGGGMLESLAQNPLGFLMKAGIKAALPKSFKNAMGRFNETIGHLPLAMQFMFNRWKNSDSKIKKFLANTFGINLKEKAKVNFGNYKKDAIPFDGVTKKAIVNVIPSLLGKILSAVSDNPTYQQELVYDYEKGQFTTKELIKKYTSNQLKSQSIDTYMGEYTKNVMAKFKPEELTSELEESINKAFKKIVDNAITPDGSIDSADLSSDPRVAKAIKDLYANMSNYDKGEFQKNIMNSISAKNRVYKNLNENYSYHNAFDIDTDMIKEIEKKEKEARMSPLEKIEKQGIKLDENGLFVRALGLDMGGTIGNKKIENTLKKSNPFYHFTEAINKATEKLGEFTYGVRKGESQVLDEDDDDDDFFSTQSSTATVNTGSRGKGRRGKYNIQANVVNVYADKMNDRIDGSHADGLERVPKDGYRAELHKDEMVLTKEEADEVRKGKKYFKAVQDKMTEVNDEIYVQQEKDGTTTMVLSGDKLKEFVTKKVFNPIKEKFKKHVLDPIKKGFNFIKDYMKENIFKPISKAFDPLKNKAKNWLKGKKDSLFEWARNTFLGGETIKDKLGKLDGKIKNGVGSLTNSIGRFTHRNDVVNSKASRRREAMLRAGYTEKEIDELTSEAKGPKSLEKRLSEYKAKKRKAEAKEKASEIKENVKSKTEKIKKKVFKPKDVKEVTKEVNSDAINVKMGTLQSDVTTIKDTLIDFYNAFLSSQGIEADGVSERKSGGRFGKIKGFFKSKFNSMREKLSNFGEMLKNPIGWIGKKLKKVGGGLLSIPKKIFDGITTVTEKISNLTKTLFDEVVKPIGGFVAEQLPKLMGGLKDLAGKFIDGAKDLLKTGGKLLGNIASTMKDVTATLYKDLKGAVKEVWGTAKSAVSGVFGAIFGKGKKSGKEKKMRVIIDGGYLDGIRETVHITNKKKKNSYQDMKNKYLEEQAEDDALKDKNEVVGDEGREGNESRLSSRRERLNALLQPLISKITEPFKKVYEFGKQKLATAYGKGKSWVGGKLANVSGNSAFSKATRKVGRYLQGNKTVSQVEAEGATAVHIMGSNVPIGGGSSATDIADSIGDMLTGKGGKKAGIFTKMFSKFGKTGIGQKFLGTGIGKSLQKNIFNGKGFWGNTKILGGKANKWFGDGLTNVLNKTTTKSKFESNLIKSMTRAGVRGEGITGMLSKGGKFLGGSALRGAKSLGSKALGKAGKLGGKALAKVGGKAGLKAIGKAGLKAIPGIGTALAVADGAIGGVKGWKKANEYFDTDNATFGQKLASGTAGVLNSLSFGLIGGEKTANFLHKAGTTLTNLIPGVGLYRSIKKRRKEKKQLEEEKKSKIEYENRKLAKEKAKLSGSTNSSDDIDSQLKEQDITEISTSKKLGGDIIPFVSPTLFMGRNLIKVYRKNKEKQDEAEKKLLQQMSPKEKEEYLASKTNSDVLSGKTTGNPITGFLNSLFGGKSSSSSKKKGGIFSSIGKTLRSGMKKITSLLGINAIASTSSDSDKSDSNSWFSKIKNKLFGKSSSSGSGSNNSGSGGVVLSGGDTAEQTWNFLKAKGFSDAATAAVMGNIQQESNWNLLANDGTTNEGTGAHGLFQWQGGRFNGLKSYASKKGLNWWDLEAQLGYFVDEDLPSQEYFFGRNSNTTIAQWKQSNDVALATRQFEESFERAGIPMIENRIKYANQYYNKFQGTSGSTSGSSKAVKVLETARSKLGVPYEYGATGPNRFDCSGLTQWAYAQNGVKIGRTTFDQINNGREVSQNELKMGDLVFPHSGHVGIYAGNNQYLHAPKTGDVVKISPITKFWRARRIIGGPTLTANGGITKGVITSLFGRRKDPFTGEEAFHSGIDIAGEEGTDIKSYADGVVDFAGVNDEYGNMVKLRHANGLSTVYGHAKELLVKEGDTVSKGTSIARMGSTGRSTGSHLHFEMQKNGRFINPSTYKDLITTKSNSSSVSSVYSNKTDSSKMEKYTEMVNILNTIADNTSNIAVTNVLLEKMFTLLEEKVKDDKKTSKLSAKRVDNPFISGIDNDISIIAQGV